VTTRGVSALGFAIAGTIAATACTTALFDSIHYPDRSRPVARIETRGGVEFGATTSDGILFLGRTATEGPCRVHYFLGGDATPQIEDGEIHALGGVLYTADIDLKHQSVAILARDLAPNDLLFAMVHTPREVAEVPVRLSDDPGLEGDVLDWPGVRLPAGTAVFVREEDDLLLVGLVSGEVTVEGDGGARRYVAMAGPDRLREALAVPRVHPTAPEVKHRPDDISVRK
jgi:hypothetical protein